MPKEYDKECHHVAYFEERDLPVGRAYESVHEHERLAHAHVSQEQAVTDKKRAQGERQEQRDLMHTVYLQERDKPDEGVGYDGPRDEERRSAQDAEQNTLLVRSHCVGVQAKHAVAGGESANANAQEHHDIREHATSSWNPMLDLREGYEGGNACRRVPRIPKYEPVVREKSWTWAEMGMLWNDWRRPLKPLPMTRQPAAWRSVELGPYRSGLHSENAVMKFKEGTEEVVRWLMEGGNAEISKASPREARRASARTRLFGSQGYAFHGISSCIKQHGGLEHMYDALNCLGGTPWHVNRPVFDTMKTMWEGGDFFAEFRDRVGLPVKSKIPRVLEPKPKDAIFRLAREKHNLVAHTTTESFPERIQRYINSKRVRQDNLNNYSIRSTFQYHLNTAKKFRDHDRVYFPHNMDFRGRVYPMHPYLNHIGCDFTRSLLSFKHTKPIGPKGWRWLLIHLANLHGKNKLSLHDRVAFSEAHIEAIRDSARDPINGSRWWAEAEAPYQCLATCIEINQAMESDSREAYECGQPIHQDGSCNGLQHYAALSRDMEGGRSVNLLPGDKPGDVYSRVARFVEEEVQRRAMDPSCDKWHEECKLLFERGEIDRKFVKQTVMTKVYGVTTIGATDQIFNRLTERGYPHQYMPTRPLAMCGANLTLKALESAFENASSTMKWLTICAAIIAKSGDVVRWQTPLGVPVLQPYRKPFRESVMDEAWIAEQEANVLKQTQAFPPNYVHSLDSTHLMLTANACNRKGVTFAGVHDSFWTHACDVDQLNSVLRDKFVELHSGTLLEDLLDGFRTNYPNLVFPEVPERGTLELKDVKNSVYFFS